MSLHGAPHTGHPEAQAPLSCRDPGPACIALASPSPRHSRSHSQPRLVPPLSPHLGALPRGSQEPEEMERWVWLGERIWILGQSSIQVTSAKFQPHLTLQGGHCYCLTLPWELLACSEREHSSVCDLHAALPALTVTRASPLHPSQSEEPTRVLWAGLGGAPSQRDPSWAPPPLGPEAQATPTPWLQCF